MSSGPKVLMITGDYPPAVTGVGDYTFRLIESLARDGVEVEVFTGAAPGKAPASGWGAGVFGRVVRSVDRLGPRVVVHIQYPALAYGRWPTVNLLPGLLKLLRPGCKVVITMHEFRSMRRRWRLRVVPMLLAADAVILPDELDRPLVSRWTRPRRARVVSIPIGPNLLPVPMHHAEEESWRSELGLPGQDPIVVFFGGVYEHKGVLELISAIRALRDDARIPVRLLLVGAPDPGGRFQAQVERLLQQGREQGWARWLPDAPSDVVSRCLHVADLAAFPFHSGAMTNRGSLLVALAHGVPAVTTRTEATPAEFGEGTGMVLVPPRDASALAASMAELLRAPKLRNSLSQGGLRYASAFSWDAVARQTLELYVSLCPETAQLGVHRSA